MILSQLQLTFKPVEVKDPPLFHEWLVKPHILEWIHGVRLQNILNGLQKVFQSKSNTTYWIGYDNDIPFAFLITFPEGNSDYLRFVHLRPKLPGERDCCTNDSRVFDHLLCKCNANGYP